MFPAGQVWGMPEPMDDIANPKRAMVRSWCLYDWANSAYVTTVAVAVLPAYFAAVVVPEGGWPVLGAMVPAASLWGYLMSATALAVFLAAPLLGAVADHSGLLRRFLGLACLMGSVAAMGLWLAGPGLVWRTMALFAVAHVGFIGGNVFYDAMLTHVTVPERYDMVSGRGYAWGYMGGGLQFALALGLVAGHDALGLDAGQGARLAMVMAGVWWGGFGLWAVSGLREPRGRPLPGDPHGPARLAAYARLAFSRLARTTGRVREMPVLLTFLVAFLLYNDGIQTTIAMATIYGKAELGLSTTVLMLTLLMIQFVAVFGALAFSRLARRITARRALMLAVALWTGIVGWAYVMDSATEYVILGAMVGLVLGGSQALSRSVYARLVPSDAPAEFFAYFSVVNRLSAIGGPLVFAVIAQVTGSSRLAILSLGMLFVAGFLVLWRLRLPEGE